MKKQNNEYKKYRLYGVIGMTGLFLMGIIVGFVINGFSMFNHQIKQKIQTLKPQIEQQITNERTCEKIEILLIDSLDSQDIHDSETHIDNAKIYANLSERGCPENSAKFKALAKSELEIARALNDDHLDDVEESVEIVETYKRLQMQAEAERMIEKAKKLTNPAIDFIIELEKIIEED